MDPDIITINLPSDEASYLIGMLNKNCEAAEQLAIEAVTGMDMPFLNPLRELTKGECLQILKKHQNIFNVFEQALVLSGLTDYITCAFQNELFDTFRKKSDRDGLPTILITLNMQWVRFFQKLRQCDLTHAQLKSVIFLLKQSLKRLPETYQKSFFPHALAVGESCLKKAQMKPQYYSPTAFTDIMTTNRIKPQKEPETITQEQITTVNKADSKIQNHSVKPRNDARVLNQKTVLATNKTNEGKQKNCCVKLKTGLKSEVLNKKMTAPVNKIKADKKHVGAASKTTICTPKHTLDFVQLRQPVAIVDLTESVEGPVKSPIQKTQMKYSSDITKYILKPQENIFPDREMAQCSKISDDLLTEGKENQKIWSVSTPAAVGSDSDIILKESVAHVTPMGKSPVVIDVDCSLAKKPRMEKERKVTNCKVNAFELMMKQSRASKGQDMKWRSLFQ